MKMGWIRSFPCCQGWLSQGMTKCFVCMWLPPGFFLQGSGFRAGEWPHELKVARGKLQGAKKKERTCVTWLWLSWFVMYCGPCCCPFPGVAHKSVLPKSLLSLRYLRPWYDWHPVTLSYDSTGAERESAKKWYWDTHAHGYTYMPVQMHACTHKYSKQKHALRSIKTHQLGNENTSRPWCVCMSRFSCSRGRIHQALEKVHTGPQMFCTSCIMLLRCAILGNRVYGTIHRFLYEHQFL